VGSGRFQQCQELAREILAELPHSAEARASWAQRPPRADAAFFAIDFFATAGNLMLRKLLGESVELVGDGTVSAEFVPLGDDLGSLRLQTLDELLGNNATQDGAAAGAAGAAGGLGPQGLSKTRFVLPTVAQLEAGGERLCSEEWAALNLRLAGLDKLKAHRTQAPQKNKTKTHTSSTPTYQE